MKALTYVEIDLDYCSLSYGVGACTASIPTTGARKCMNTLKTCQVRTKFVNAPITLRFAQPAAYLPADIEAIHARRAGAANGVIPGRSPKTRPARDTGGLAGSALSPATWRQTLDALRDLTARKG